MDSDPEAQSEQDELITAPWVGLHYKSDHH